MGKRDLYLSIDKPLEGRKTKKRYAKVLTWQTKVYTTYANS